MSRFQKKQELSSAQIVALCRSVRTESARYKVKQQEQTGAELEACSLLLSATTGKITCGSGASNAAGLPSTRNCSANRKRCFSPDMVYKRRWIKCLFRKERDIVADEKNRVCPVTLAGGLDNRIRRWLQNPRKILEPHVKKGMKVLDIGCGPGFFSVELAQMVGKSGRVVALDLQEGMLRKLSNKIRGTELEERITLHKCEKDSFGLSELVDFTLAFYMVHEIPDQERFLNDIKSVLKPGGQVLIVEPPLHASKKGFEGTVRKAQDVGFIVIDWPKMFPNKAVLLQKR
jgi:SAM-dependent methyltransferase